MKLFTDNHGKTDIKTILLGLGFVIIVVVGGHFIAKKIFDIPTRKDVLLFLGVILFIPVLKFPKIGLYYLFLVPPFIPLLRRVYYIVSARPENDLLHLISDAVVILLMAVLLDQVRKGQRVKYDDRTLYILIWIYLGYQALRAVVWNTEGKAVGLHHFKFVALYICCFFFAIYFIDTKKEVVRIFKITSFLGLFIAAYGIKQAFLGYTKFEQIWLDVMREKFVTLFIEGKARPFSTLISPACFADYMIISIITSYCLFLMKIKNSRLFLVFIPIMFFGLLLTSVRSNWLGFMVGFILWFVIAHRSSIKVKISVLSVVFIFFMAGFSLLEMVMAKDIDLASYVQPDVTSGEKDEKKVTELFVTDRMSAVANPFGERSMISRYEMWKTVMRLSVKLPRGPFGYGMGGFDAHSYYFSTLFDIGYVGLFMLLFILYRIFRLGYINYLEEEQLDRRVMIRGILAFLFIMCVINATGTHIASHPGDIYFWFFSGILMVIRRLKSGESWEQDAISEKVVDAT
jgi:hypothetical protein